MSELLKYKYLARYKQVETIAKEELEEFSNLQANYDEESQRLNDLLYTPAVFRPRLYEKYRLTESSYITSLFPLVGSEYGITFSSMVFETLLNACDPDLSYYPEVAIDQIPNTVPDVYTYIFKGYDDRLTEAVKQGKETATRRLLDVMQGSIPLLRYPIDIAAKRLLLTPTLEGGQMCRINTKVEGVDAKL